MLRAIDTAQEFIVLDWFLFNDHRGPASRKAPAAHRALSAELRDRLLARRLAKPDLRVLFITDPINDIYGSAPSADLATLREAGVEVVVTDLDRLRDSNPLYSALWRLTARWWADAEPGTGRLANPLDTGPARISLGAWLELLNFKANHRKLLVADDGCRQGDRDRVLGKPARCEQRALQHRPAVFGLDRARGARERARGGALFRLER